MMNINYMKAGIAALGLVCLTVLMAVSAVPAATAMPIVTLIVGYAVGNGIAAKQDVPVEPIISRRQEHTYEIEAPANVHVSPPADPERDEFDAWKKAQHEKG